MTSANRRAANRQPVTIPGFLALAYNTEACVIRNLSLGGALVARTATSRIALGTEGRLSFSLSTLGEPIVADLTIRWWEDRAVGVQFGALRAKEVWALGTYLELLKPAAR